MCLLAFGLTAVTVCSTQDHCNPGSQPINSILRRWQNHPQRVSCRQAPRRTTNLPLKNRFSLQWQTRNREWSSVCWMSLGGLLVTSVALFLYFSKEKVKHLRKEPALAAGSLPNNIAFNPGMILRTFLEIFFFPIFPFCVCVAKSCWPRFWQGVLRTVEPIRYIISFSFLPLQNSLSSLTIIYFAVLTHLLTISHPFNSIFLKMDSRFFSPEHTKQYIFYTGNPLIKSASVACRCQLLSCINLSKKEI